MQKMTLHDLSVEGKRVLMRVDFNVPMKDGVIRDDTRIVQALPTIEYVLGQGAKLILMSHLGRPKGQVVQKLSLRPVAEHLSKLLGKEVKLAPDSVGAEVEKECEALENGSVLLLENVRFHPGEQHPQQEPEYVNELAKLGEIYVNDAFGTAHRSHASTTLVAKLFEGRSSTGFLMDKEISFLSSLVSSPKRPFYAIIGGAKVGSKIGVLESLSDRIDGIFIGGGMAFTFLKVQGLSIGDSIYDPEFEESAKRFLETCQERAVKVWLPKDVVITDGSEVKTISVKSGIPDGWKGYDIGPQTLEEWSGPLQGGATIFWNGPMGVFEEEAFAKGTHHLAVELSQMEATTIVGGGDSVAAINQMGLNKNFTHLSTGGGASLEYLEHGHLPGIDALSNR